MAVALISVSMTQKRLLALLSLIMALIAGILLILDIMIFPREITLRWLVDRAMAVALGLVAIIGGLMTYDRRYVPGGAVNLVVGVLAIVVVGEFALGVLILLAGILSLVAEGA